MRTRGEVAALLEAYDRDRCPCGGSPAWIDPAQQIHRVGCPRAPRRPRKGACRWFALCGRPAEGTLRHPVLGDVPCCRRCAARVGEEMHKKPLTA